MLKKHGGHASVDPSPYPATHHSVGGDDPLKGQMSPGRGDALTLRWASGQAYQNWCVWGQVGLVLLGKTPGCRAPRLRRPWMDTRGFSREGVALALLLICCGVIPLGLSLPIGTKRGQEDQ